MLEKLRGLPKTLLDMWKGWSRAQKAIVLSSIAASLIAAVILAFVLSRPNFQILTTCKDYSELSSVTTLLTSNNYEYKVEDGTLVVKVKKENLTDCKMLIASENIQSDGYSFEDAMTSSFTTTESDKTKQYQQYLSSKFAEDLAGIDGVKNASVTVQIADKTNSFYASTAETTVSVVLNTSKTLSDDVAESMANFLATAVGNGSTKSITIIDSNGNTLFNGASSTTVSGTSYGNQMKYKGQIEATTKTNMKNAILATGLYDDVYLNLNYNLDWDAVNTIATEYTPAEGQEQGLFSSAYTEDSIGSDGASGTPGTSSNNSDDTTYYISDGTTSTSEYHVTNYNYLPNSLVTTTVKEPGQIIYNTSTLSVVFIRNVVYKEEELKARGDLDNTTWEQFKADNANPIQTDVDQTWAQILQQGTGVVQANISLVAWQRPWFEDAPPSNIFNTISFWAQVLLAIAILGLLVFVILRSARPLTVEETEPELSVEDMLATTKENQPAIDDIDMQEKSETRKAIEKFVDENPEAVALLLRNWLNEDWD